MNTRLNTLERNQVDIKNILGHILQSLQQQQPPQVEKSRSLKFCITGEKKDCCGTEVDCPDWFCVWCDGECSEVGTVGLENDDNGAKVGGYLHK
jgi:hypothetical protein